MKDFFISYNRADRTWAEWIAWQLEEADYTTVLQAWDFTPGTNFVLKMHEAAIAAERTIAVLSPAYLASSFTKPEWAAAFAQDPTGEKGLLIPIRVRKCDPEGLLGQIVFQDVVGLDEAAAKVALLATVKPGRAKPDTKPAFPPTAGRSVTLRPRFPGALPPIWNVPHRRNPNFTGREELLDSLHKSLNSGEYAALTQAMHGLGGVGKTQTAIEYAYRYASEYNAVLWVPAEDTAALAGYFAALAGEIGIEADPADQPATVAAVQRWLREHPRWLLIFDNVETSAGVQHYLPQAGTGHVVITSRNPEWRRVARPLPVEHFTTTEAVALLFTRAGRDDADENERVAAATLAQELGGFALALEQAAAYVETHGLCLAEYLHLFQHHREDVLSRDSLPEYPHTVETVWAISFRALERVSPASTELLFLLAFFAPDDIPISLIRSGADLLPAALSEAVRDDVTLWAAIRALRRHSLVEVGTDGLSVHRVVQAATRRAMTNQERPTWADRSAKLVAAALPAPTNIDQWPFLARLASHASILAQHCENEQIALVDAAFCLNETGLYLVERADYESSMVHFQRALRMYESVLGPDHSFVGTCVNNLGTVYKELGNLLEARVHFERAVRMAELSSPVDTSELATRINNLAIVQQAAGDLDGARANYEWAIQIGEATLGPDHPNVAVRINNLGTVLEASGDLEGARANYERALRIDQAALGSNHPNVAIRMSNLGSVLQSLGDLPGALANITLAWSILRDVLGNDHPRTQIAEAKLASVLRGLDDESE